MLLFRATVNMKTMARILLKVARPSREQQLNSCIAYPDIFDSFYPFQCSLTLLKQHAEHKYLHMHALPFDPFTEPSSHHREVLTSLAESFPMMHHYAYRLQGCQSETIPPQV